MAAMNAERTSGAETEDGSLKIMLFGKGGVGKSSSGNTILGRQEFKSDMSVKRVTLFCEKGVGTVRDVPVDESGELEDVEVSVIDTPGLFEKDSKREEIMRRILKSRELLKWEPHAFVLVVPVGRMTQEDQNTQALIQEKFGPRVWDYTIVLFTHGDHLGDKTINDLISESDENLRNFIRKCGGGFHVFNNKDQQDQKQVTSLIAKIQTLVALNGGGRYHTKLYPKEEGRIRNRQKSILKERDDEIKREESLLEENYQGEDLEMMKKGLWSREEENARLTAEKEARVNTYALQVFLVAIMAMACVFLGAKYPPLLLLPVVIVLILFLLFHEDPGAVQRKLPWAHMKND